MFFIIKTTKFMEFKSDQLQKFSSMELTSEMVLILSTLRFSCLILNSWKTYPLPCFYYLEAFLKKTDSCKFSLKKTQIIKEFSEWMLLETMDKNQPLLLKTFNKNSKTLMLNKITSSLSEFLKTQENN
jgi:hypothetical protein